MQKSIFTYVCPAAQSAASLAKDVPDLVQAGGQHFVLGRPLEHVDSGLIS